MVHRPARHRPIGAAVLALIVASLAAASAVAQAPTPAALRAPGPTASASPAPSASPAVTPAPEASRPEGTWRVSAYDPLGDGLVEALPGSRLTVAFLSAGHLEGETRCGSYLGGYSVDGELIRLGIVARGPGRCRPRREAEAAGLTQALSVASRWRPRPDGGLEILDEAGRVRLVLAPDDAGQLTGAWHVVRHVASRGRLRDVTTSPGPSIVFGVDGKVEGSTGCRPFDGSYDGEGDRLLVAPIDVIGQPCDGPAGRRERQLLRAFDRTVAWKRDDDVLRLLDASGDPLVVAEPVGDVAAPSTAPSASASPSTAPG
jgi:heat shock protein HslJ